MIMSKEDLQFYLDADKFSLNRDRNKPSINDLVWKYQILLRKYEYYLNNQDINLFHKLLYVYYKFRSYRLGIKLGFDIPPNVFGAGLRINHFGNIVVNEKVKIGMWCDICQGVNIGTTSSDDGRLLVPSIGSNVWIGPGAKIFGDIQIGNGAIIGANTVVNKGVPANSTAVGVPSKIIKTSGTECRNMAASVVHSDQFFMQYPQFKKYKESQ